MTTKTKAAKKSRKAVVYEAWRTTESTTEELSKLVKRLSLSTIRTWRSEWGRGQGLPKGYGTKSKKSAKKSK